MNTTTSNACLTWPLLPATLGRLPWLWDRPADSWLREGAAHLPRWEGCVLKRLQTPYEPLIRTHHTSWQWLKAKW